MMITMYLIFMIPLSFMGNKMMFQFHLMISLIMFLMLNSNSFLSSLSYFLSQDFISYGLIILTLLIISLMVISMKNIISMNMFLMSNLMLCISLVLIFSVNNLMYMYIFFEFSLIPLLLMIFGWGYQPERLKSGLYLFFYTLFASLPLLILFIYVFINKGSLFINLDISINNLLIFNMIMLLAFMVKMPMFMLHFWLPKAHVQAPVFGSMILAGLLLKIGGYGIIRLMFMMELLFKSYSFIWYTLSLVGAVSVSLICLIQSDVKCMIAYSSVAHMSMCIMSLMTMSNWGMFGNYMLMLSHGLCSSALFCLVSIGYERYKTRSFFINKGQQSIMPSMTLMWFMFCAFNMSCPPSLNFISEIYIFTSMMFYWFNSYIMFIFISFLSACFSYYLFSYTQHGNFHFSYSYVNGSLCEYLMLTVLLIPILAIIFMFNFLY